MKKIDFDGYAGDYNALLRESTDFFTEDESYFARYKVAIAAGLMETPPARVLEFGCGIGRNVPFLREAFPGAEIMGSDVSAKSIELAAAANPGVHFWVEGDESSERHGFDLVFVAGVFHHIPPVERTGAAATIVGRMNPGGTLVVFEHNPYNPVTRKIVSECPYDEGVELLRPAELAAHLAAAGLRTTRRGFSLFFPPKLRALVWLEPMLAWLPLGGQYWVRAAKA